MLGALSIGSTVIKHTASTAITAGSHSDRQPLRHSRRGLADQGTPGVALHSWRVPAMARRPAPCAKLLNACAELYKLQATSATLPVLKDDTEVQYCCLQKGCRTGCESSAARVLSWFCVVTCFLPTTCGQPDSAPLVLGQAMCYVYWWGMCSSGPKNQW